MKYCTLYLSDITSRDGLHDRLKGALMLPDYYGMNLDALKDCLTDMREEVTVHVIGFETMAEALPPYAESFRRVTEDACRENPHLHFLFH